MKLFGIIIMILSVIKNTYTQSNCGMSEKKGGFLIYGKIDGLKDCTRLYLIHSNDNGDADTLSIVQSKGEKFYFTGKISREGEFFFIKMDTIETKLQSGQKKYITLLLDNSMIEIYGSIKNWPNLNIIGSRAHKDYQDYESFVKPIKKDMEMLMNKMVKIRKSMKDTITNNLKSELYNKLYSEYISLYNLLTDTLRVKYIEAHLDSYFTPWLILRKYHDINSLENAYNRLTPQIKESSLGLMIMKEIITRKRVQIGKNAPNLYLPTIKEEQTYLSIKEVYSKSRFTLIDFWASWCGPCRKGFPKLKKLYDKYRLKGFNILGISTDVDIAASKKMISYYQLPWNNVIDIKQNAVNVFDIKTIPQFYLLDDKGIIISRDSNLENIEKLLISYYN